MMDRKANFGDFFDRFSDLPDSILCHILSFLPSNDALRTAVLSTRWKHIFASVPSLDFDYTPASDSESHASDVRRFMTFMDKVLVSHSKCCVERFRLRVCGYSIDSARDWVSLLSNGILELDLCIDTPGVTSFLPPSIFTRSNLKVLKLDSKLSMNVSVEFCLPNLKILRLESIIFQDDVSVQRLFSGCLALEDLVMVSCDLMKVSLLSISNPTLKRLMISSRMGRKGTRQGIHDHELALDTPSLVYFNYDGYLTRSCSFINLQTLEEVCVGTGRDEEERAYHLYLAQSTVTPLVCCCPSLVQPLSNWARPKLVNGAWCEQEETRFCPSPYLEQINIHNFESDGDSEETTKYFIRNVIALRELNMYWCECAMSEEDINEVVMELGFWGSDEDL